MSKTFDVIVIGVGTMGAAACRHLARAGVRVLGLEQFDIPNTMASHHGSSRMIRLCYFEHPDYVPLLRRSYELWRELEHETAREILHVTGGLYMGPPNSEVITGCLRSAREHRLPHETLDRHALRQRYPQFEVPDDFIAMFDHDAGFVLPERAVSAHVDLALRAGAEIHAREAVREWVATSDGVTVKTSRDEYSAAKLIITTGAWINDVVADSGVQFVVTRQTLAWVWPKTPSMFERGTLPVWLLDQSDGTTHYGFPMIADNPGFKLARHSGGTPISDPDRLERDPQPGDEESVRSVLRRYIPQADGPLLGLRQCMYTNTRDGDFVIDRHPAHDNVIVASPCSGHGFKFQPVMGQILAELATTGRSTLPIDFLRADRLRRR